MKRWVLVSFAWGLCFCAATAAQALQADGNLKYRLVNTAYPSSSVYSSLIGSNATDHSLAARLNLSHRVGNWSLDGSYQITGVKGDTIELTGDQPSGVLIGSSVPNDDSRLFDLTDVIDDGQDFAFAHRIDRLLVGYQSDQNVIKLGRQAVSWGNGLIYAPMDFFNPFDPAAIDTEYKTGDDMLYAQHLFDSGNDLQMVWVVRRDANQNTNRAVNSVALKYHSIVGSSEFDLMLAEHYDDTLIGIGGSISVGGSVLRGDWVVSDTGEQRFSNVVTNISYSWTAWNKNVTWSLEYFHNDFGVSSTDLSVSDLANETELLSRFQRGELFTLGRDYVAGSATIEMTPLWLLTPNIFYNLSDNSALTQLVSQHDLTQNMQLSMALSLPLGTEGTEYGGLRVGNATTNAESKFSNSDWSFYAQLAWYF